MSATSVAPVRRLWISQRGVVACDSHGGDYLRTGCEKFPRLLSHCTPLDSWQVVLPQDGVHGLSCEQCGATLSTIIL